MSSAARSSTPGQHARVAHWHPAPAPRQSARADPQRQGVVQMLQRDRWIGQWPQAVLASLAAAARIARYRDGERIRTEGERCDDVLVVLDGAIELSWARDDGRRLVQFYLSPGMVANLVPLLDGGGHMHDHHARGPVRVGFVPGTLLLEHIDRDPALLRAVVGLLGERSRLLYEEARHQGLASLPARLARQLLVLARHHGVLGLRGLEIGLGLSQEELGALLGASRQSINKALRDLSARGVVSTEYSRIVILNQPALQALAR